MIKSIKFLNALFAAALISSAASAQSLKAVVVSVTGKAEVQRNEIWVQLKEGDTLSESDVISTGFKSSMVLQINTAKLTVNALTRLTIDELAASSSKDATKVYVQSGSVDASISKSSKQVDFSVSSPVATASVRGTGFHINSLGNLKVTNGSVNYHVTTSKDRQKSIPQNEILSETQNTEENSEGSKKNATVFTSASTIADTTGMAVYQGWSSTTDLTTGEQSSPLSAFEASSQVNSSGTSSLTEKESSTFTTMSGNSDTDASVQSSSSSLQTSGTAEVTVIIN